MKKRRHFYQKFCDVTTTRHQLKTKFFEISIEHQNTCKFGTFIIFGLSLLKFGAFRPLPGVK